LGSLIENVSCSNLICEGDFENYVLTLQGGNANFPLKYGFFSADNCWFPINSPLI
jgi:hypothetical protein